MTFPRIPTSRRHFIKNTLAFSACVAASTAFGLANVETTCMSILAIEAAAK